MRISVLLMLFWVALSCPLSSAAADVDVQAFVRKDSFNTIKISPNGEYLAATVPVENKTALVIMSRADNKVTATFQLGKNTHVQDFWWVNPERVLISIAEKLGALDQPQLTGEIYAINADGSHPDILVGQRVQGGGLGTKIQPKKVEQIAAFMVDDLPGDDRNVIISVIPFTGDPYARAEKMDVYSGRRARVALAPIRNAEFVTDNAGVVRFARGAGMDLVSKLYYRPGDGGSWKLINDEQASGHAEHALGFSGDDSTAYLRVEQDKGPDAIVAMDVASGQRREVLRDANADPEPVLHHLGNGSVPVGAVFMDGKPRTAFFDPASSDARLYRSLEAAFQGDRPLVTSSTADGRLALVQTYSDRNPGDFYIFDTVARKADHLLSRRQWFDPEQMAEMRPISLTARDGTPLQGYLTIPHGSDGKRMPLVVLPHGGPFGIFDSWQFDDDGQLLAAAGYAVLQVNFRGSGDRGRAFTRAGARQWGGAMQDDLTDATRWAIEQGYADAGRVCLYGASYGGYAALMGVAREPALYKCAAGYVGVYDLPTMHTHGDVQQRGSGETYLREWLGDRAALGAVSPNRMADRIKVPVFLAAGGEDQRAPIEHSKLMEKALRTAGVPVETLYFPSEGHGFYVESHRKEFYEKLLAFLGRNIGGAKAAASK